MTLIPASDKTFAKIVPEQQDEQAIRAATNRILGISDSTVNSEPKPVEYASSQR